MVMLISHAVNFKMKNLEKEEYLYWWKEQATKTEQSKLLPDITWKVQNKNINTKRIWQMPKHSGKLIYIRNW